MAPCSEQHTRSRLRMPSNLMFFLIFVSSFFYLILDSIPFFPPFFLFFSFFSFSFFSFFFSFLDTEYNPTGTTPEPFLAHCLCWWGFWRRLLASFWLRNDPKTVVILWFLFVYSPIKLSKRRIKFDQHFPITLHQAVHNARVSPSSLVASTTTLRLQ